MNCCLNNLGSFAHNQPVNVGINAPVDGTYTFYLTFFGTRLVKKAYFDTGEKLIIPTPFNESYQYGLQILAPNGTYVEDNNCQFFSFNTFISIEGECGNECQEIEPYL